MKTKFYFLAVAVVMATVFGGCKEKEEPELEWSVSTQPASEVTINSARLVGMTSTTEMEVTELGFYYDTTRDMYGQMKATATDGFSAVITDLAANTTYYYYAYATAYGKTKQGDVRMFKTQAPTAPTVETLEAVGSTFKGNLTSDGGSTVTALGFVYGTDQNNLTQTIRYTSSIGIGGFSCTPSGLTNGATYYYKAYAVNSVDTAYGAVRSLNAPINGHEWIDLGLPSGMRWATSNVGASKPEDYGGRYGKGTSVTWGGNWQTPTRADVLELIGTCSATWTTVNDVYGYRFTGPNGKSIFLPAAGYNGGSTSNYDVGKKGYYWTSTSWTSGNYTYYYFLDFSNNSYNANTGQSSSYNLYSIRPCCPR